MASIILYGLFQFSSNKSLNDFFLAGKNVPWVAAMFSIVATETSVLTFISIPGISLRVVRYDKIKVRYYKEDGTSVKKPMNGFMSKLFQHELDHLNGVLMFQNDVLEGFALKDDSITPELYNKLLIEEDGNS